MPTSSKVELTNASQIAFARLLGLDVRDCSIGVARAMIEDVVSTQFRGKADLGCPSPKQCALAVKFGLDIAKMSRAVGSAVIDDIMFQLNREAIELHRLAPGVRVRRKGDILGLTSVISSITEEGTVYFKGGNGKKAWARSLERTE